MKKKLVIKEIDKFISTLHKDRIYTEYIIYVIIDDNIITPLEAYTEIGESAKSARVNELILIHFISEDPTQESPKKEEIIEEISFEEYVKELKKIWKK